MDAIDAGICSKSYACLICGISWHHRFIGKIELHHAHTAFMWLFDVWIASSVALY